jgi:hypothetical protein
VAGLWHHVKLGFNAVQYAWKLEFPNNILVEGSRVEYQQNFWNNLRVTCKSVLSDYASCLKIDLPNNHITNLYIFGVT